MEEQKNESFSQRQRKLFVQTEKNVEKMAAAMDVEKMLMSFLSKVVTKEHVTRAIFQGQDGFRVQAPVKKVVKYFYRKELNRLCATREMRIWMRKKILIPKFEALLATLNPGIQLPIEQNHKSPIFRSQISAEILQDSIAFQINLEV